MQHHNVYPRRHFCWIELLDNWFPKEPMLALRETPLQTPSTTSADFHESQQQFKQSLTATICYPAQATHSLAHSSS